MIARDKKAAATQATGNPRKRKSCDDDLEPVGLGPMVVLTHSPKMSIYGPNFNYGPIQLRKQRLEAKWRKEKEMKLEADQAMERKIAELKAAQKESEERALFHAIADQIQAQDKQEKLQKLAMENQQAHHAQYAPQSHQVYQGHHAHQAHQAHLAQQAYHAQHAQHAQQAHHAYQAHQAHQAHQAQQALQAQMYQHPQLTGYHQYHGYHPYAPQEYHQQYYGPIPQENAGQFMPPGDNINNNGGKFDEIHGGVKEQQDLNNFYHHYKL